MPKLVQPLSVTKINAAKPSDKVVKLSDGGGLALWVMPTGQKVWRVQYRRPHDKKLDTLTVGNYPVIGLAEARQRREEIRQDIANGNDPKRERKRREEEKRHATAMNFKAVALEWHSRWGESVAPSTAKKTLQRLENHVFPHLGNRPIKEISSRNVVDALTKLEESGMLAQVMTTRSDISKIFVFALARGLVDNNPASGLSKAFSPYQRTNFDAIRASELGRLLKAIEGPEVAFRTRKCILFQLLTMARPVEATGARWDEINGNVWTIPPQRMKKRRPHVVHLSAPALAILEEMRPLTGRRIHIFGGNKGKPMSSNTPNAAIRRAGLDTTAHGLRALASTTLNEADFEPDVIEAALAHADDNKTRAAYNRALYLEQRREMLEWWADLIVKARKEHDDDHGSGDTPPPPTP